MKIDIENKSRHSKMTSNIRPYHDSDEEFISPSDRDGYSNRREEHPQDVNQGQKNTPATQGEHFEDILESALMDHKVEDYGQTPLLPPTYSDATAGKAVAKDHVNGRRKVAKSVLKFMTILVGLGFIFHAINVCISLSV